MQRYVQAAVLTVIASQAVGYLRVCYYTNWSQYRPKGGKYTPDRVDPNLCTHIMFAFAKLEGNKLVPFEWNDDSTEWSLGSYAKINNLKQQNPRLKTLLAVGGWNAGSPPFSDMAATGASRAEFVNTTIGFLRDRGFDGLDMDWEYPVNRGGRAEDKGNLVILLNELRAAFEQEAVKTGTERLLLSAAVPAGKSNIVAGYDVPRVARPSSALEYLAYLHASYPGRVKALDFINLMAYDLHGSWESKTGHNSPLYARGGEHGDERLLNMNWAANYWVQQGAPKEKLIIGLALYGRSFRLTSSSDSSMGAPVRGAGKAGKYTREAGFLAYYEICELLGQGATRVWNAEQRVPYLVKDNLWVGYDDVQSIKEKIRWLKDGGFGGAMVWSIALDDFSGEFCGSGPYPLLRTINMELGDQLTGSSSSLSSDFGAIVNALIPATPVPQPKSVPSSSSSVSSGSVVIPSSPVIVALPPTVLPSDSTQVPAENEQMSPIPVAIDVPLPPLYNPLPRVTVPKLKPSQPVFIPMTKSFPVFPMPDLKLPTRLPIPPVESSPKISIPIIDHYTREPIPIPPPINDLPSVILTPTAPSIEVPADTGRVIPTSSHKFDKVPSGKFIEPNGIRVNIPPPPPFEVPINIVNNAVPNAVNGEVTVRNSLPTSPVNRGDRVTDIHKNKPNRASYIPLAIPQAIPIDFGSDMMPPDVSNLYPTMLNDERLPHNNARSVHQELPPPIVIANEVIAAPTIKWRNLITNSNFNPPETTSFKAAALPRTVATNKIPLLNKPKQISKNPISNIAISVSNNKQHKEEKTKSTTIKVQTNITRTTKVTQKNMVSNNDAPVVTTKSAPFGKGILNEALALGPVNDYVPNLYPKGSIDYRFQNRLNPEAPRIISLFDSPTMEPTNTETRPTNIVPTVTRQSANVMQPVMTLPQGNPRGSSHINDDIPPPIVIPNRNNRQLTRHSQNRKTSNNHRQKTETPNAFRQNIQTGFRVRSHQSNHQSASSRSQRAGNRNILTRMIRLPSTQSNAHIEITEAIKNRLKDSGNIGQRTDVSSNSQPFQQSGASFWLPHADTSKRTVGVPLSIIPIVFNSNVPPIPSVLPRIDTDIIATLLGRKSQSSSQDNAMRMNLNRDIRLIPLGG